MSYIECDYCAFLEIDDETGEEFCTVSFDEDDLEHFLSGSNNSCPYYRSNDEYEIVRHQN